MHRALNHLDSSLTALMRLATGVSFLVLMVAVMVQVIGRSFVGSSPVWTEELTRFALLFLTAFGAGLSLKSGALVNVDLISESLPGRGPWVARLLAAVATFVFAAVLLGPAWRYVSIGVRQTSPALGVRMDWIHLSVFVLLAGLMVFAALRIVTMLAGTSDGLPEPAGEVEE